MRSQLAAALGAVLLLSVVPAHAAPRDHTLTLVLDRSGQAVVTLPSFTTDGSSMTVPAKGMAAFVLERLGERVDAASDWLIGQALVVTKGNESGYVFSFHEGAFAAGRYLLSTTVTGGRSTVTIPIKGLKHDVVVRPEANLRYTGTGSVQRLDTSVGAVGALDGRQRISNGGVSRAWALSTIETDWQGAQAGELSVCVVKPEDDCDRVSWGITGETVFPAGFGFGEVFTPGQVPTGSLTAVQHFTGAATLSKAYGYGVLVAAPLPRS